MASCEREINKKGHQMSSTKQHLAAAAQNGNLEQLRRRLEEANVKYCLASYVDVHGVPKCKAFL